MDTIKDVKEVYRMLNQRSIWQCLSSEQEIMEGQIFFYWNGRREVFDNLNDAVAGFHALFDFD